MQRGLQKVEANKLSVTDAQAWREIGATHMNSSQNHERPSILLLKLHF